MPYGVPPGLRSFATENAAGPATAGANAFGSRNVLLGFRAGENLGDAATPEPSDDVIAIGVDAAQDVRGDEVIAIGTRAAQDLPVGADSIIAIGVDALAGAYQAAFAAELVGSIAIGHRAAQGLTELEDSGVTVIGHEALSQVTDPGNLRVGVTAIGWRACGASLASGSNVFEKSTFVGHEAGERVSANVRNNVAVGTRALRGAGTGTATNVINNIAIGPGALQGVTVGTGNVAIGGSGITNNSTILDGVLNDLTNGDNNVAIGREACPNLTTGDNNVVIGAGAGDAMTGGLRNTYVGDGIRDGSDGDDNVIIGQFAGDAGTLGDRNIIIGRGAALSPTGIVPDNQLIIEFRAGSGAGNPVRPMIYGRHDTGSIILGGFGHVDASGNPIDRDLDTANMTNGVKIMDGAAPAGNPVGGGFLYVTAGALNYRGSAGTVTAIAPA